MTEARKPENGTKTRNLLTFIVCVFVCGSAEARDVLKRVNPWTPAEVSDTITGAYITTKLAVDQAGNVRGVDVSHWSTSNRRNFDATEFRNAQTTSSLKLFKDAAIAAAAQWRFAPAEAESSEYVTFAFDASTTALGRTIRRVTPTFITQWFNDWWNAQAPTVRVGEGSAAPRKIVDRRPMYPGYPGEFVAPMPVVLDIQTRRNGSVANAHILTAVPQFDQYAVDAALAWKYEPLRVNGSAAEAVMTVAVEFPPLRAGR